MRPYLSASSINAFLNCPRYFAYVYEEEAEPSHVSSSLVLGSAVHIAGSQLYRGIRENQKVKKKELEEVFCESLLTLRDNNPPILFNKGETFSSMMVQGIGLVDCLFDQTPRDEKILEVDFEINVPLRNSEGKELEVPLKCILDKMVEVDGKEWAVDLKTSARKYPAEKIESGDTQSCAYCYALATRNGGGPQVFQWQVIIKAATPRMEMYVTTLGAKDFDRLYATAENAVRGIEAGSFVPVQSWRCKSCPYGELCKTWKG